MRKRRVTTPEGIMNAQSSSGMMLALGLILFGSITGWFQIRARQILAARTHVPSDELQYLGKRYRRRLITGALLVFIGVLIGAAFLSGMERRADNLGGVKREPAADGKPIIPEEDKQFVRFWGGYWIVVLILVFVVLGMASADAWATRRYWLLQYQQIREDHQTKLRRDLAVFRQQKEQNRGGISGNRLEGTSDDTET